MAVLFTHTFKGVDPSDAVRDYAERKFAALVNKFVHEEGTRAHCTYKTEGIHQRIEVHLSVGGNDIHASADGDKVYSAIDRAIEVVEQQLRKRKEKLVRHHG